MKIENIFPTEYMIKSGTHLDYEWLVGFNSMGYRCGYVLIPDSHPFVRFNIDAEYIRMGEIRVHGGITYDNYASGDRVIGFDCAHWGDAPDPTLISSKLLSLLDNPCVNHGIVRTTEFVLEQIGVILAYLIKTDDRVMLNTVAEETKNIIWRM